jgi:hypothetical protein
VRVVHCGVSGVKGEWRDALWMQMKSDS